METSFFLEPPGGYLLPKISGAAGLVRLNRRRTPNPGKNTEKA